MREYLQGAHGVIKSWMNGNSIYYYQDSHGTTTHAAVSACQAREVGWGNQFFEFDEIGQVVDKYTYDAFGQLKIMDRDGVELFPQ